MHIVILVFQNLLQLHVTVGMQKAFRSVVLHRDALDDITAHFGKHSFVSAGRVAQMTTILTPGMQSLVSGLLASCEQTYDLGGCALIGTFVRI